METFGKSLGIELNEVQKLELEMSNFKEKDVDPDYFIADKMHEFFAACQQRAAKSHLFVNEEEFNKKHAELISLGKKEYTRRQKEIIWNEDCEFAEYVDASIKDLGFNIQECQRKIKTYFANDLTPLQKQYKLFAGEIKFANPIEESRFKQVFYDIMEFMAIKHREILRSYLNGSFVPDEKKIVTRAIELDLYHDYQMQQKKKNNPMRKVTKEEVEERWAKAKSSKLKNINLN